MNTHVISLDEFVKFLKGCKSNLLDLSHEKLNLTQVTNEKQ